MLAKMPLPEPLVELCRRSSSVFENTGEIFVEIGDGTTKPFTVVRSD